jgi:hypothetical protein
MISNDVSPESRIELASEHSARADIAANTVAPLAVAEVHNTSISAAEETPYVLDSAFTYNAVRGFVARRVEDGTVFSRDRLWDYLDNLDIEMTLPHGKTASSFFDGLMRHAEEAQAEAGSPARLIKIDYNGQKVFGFVPGEVPVWLQRKQKREEALTLSSDEVDEIRVEQQPEIELKPIQVVTSPKQTKITEVKSAPKIAEVKRRVALDSEQIEVVKGMLRALASFGSQAQTNYYDTKRVASLIEQQGIKTVTPEIVKKLSRRLEQEGVMDTNHVGKGTNTTKFKVRLSQQREVARVVNDPEFISLLTKSLSIGEPFVWMSGKDSL